VTTVLTGGVRTPSDALVGPVAITALRSLHVDLLFMGVHGMSVDAGFTTPNLLEAETNQALIASARRVVVVADHTKWGVRGLSSIAELSAADTIVSDSGLSPQARAAIADEGIELILASVRPSQRRVTVAGEET
jgi:DeoR/GlpR family transcriptional regulator of sugar metabolism